MKGEKKERWMELCEQTANEQVGKELHELTLQIEPLLREKQVALGEDRIRNAKQWKSELNTRPPS